MEASTAPVITSAKSPHAENATPQANQFYELLTPDKAATAQVGQIYLLNGDDLEPNPEQTRQFFDEDRLQAMAHAIREHGQQQNITFTIKDGKFIIVAGERRVKAMKMVGQPTVIGCYAEGNLQELAILENILQEQLTAVEYAEAVQALWDCKGLKTHKELCPILGLRESTISEIFAVAGLPENIRNAARQLPHLTRDKLAHIARIKDGQEQQNAFNRLLESPKRQADYKSNAAQQDNNNATAISPAQAPKTKGAILAASLDKPLERLTKLSAAKHASKYSPEDRQGIVDKLEKLRDVVQASIDALTKNEKQLNEKYEAKMTQKAEKATPAGKKRKKSPEADLPTTPEEGEYEQYQDGGAD